jgi:hypothetical protein
VVIGLGPFATAAASGEHSGKPIKEAMVEPIGGLVGGFLGKELMHGDGRVRLTTVGRVFPALQLFVSTLEKICKLVVFVFAGLRQSVSNLSSKVAVASAYCTAVLERIVRDMRVWPVPRCTTYIESKWSRPRVEKVTTGKQELRTRRSQANGSEVSQGLGYEWSLTRCIRGQK